jgi:hypothetical protein
MKKLGRPEAAATIADWCAAQAVTSGAGGRATH